MDRKAKKYLKQLESSEPRERYEAVMALGLTGDMEVVDTLDKVANLDEHDKVRYLAGQAVITLDTLRKLRIQRDLAARGELDDLKEFDWPELMKDRMMDGRQLSEEDAREKWSYADAVAERKKKQEEEARMRAIEAEIARRAAIRRRRPFRIILILSTFLACVALVLVAQYVIEESGKPKDQIDAMYKLQTWVQEQQASLTGYGEQFTVDPLVCADLLAVGVPAKPAWVVPEEPFLEGQDDIVTDLESISQVLNDIKTESTTACEGKETLPQAEWPQFTTSFAQQQRYFNVAGSTASLIEGEITRLEAERDAAAAEAEAGAEEAPPEATQDPGG